MLKKKCAGCLDCHCDWNNKYKKKVAGDGFFYCHTCDARPKVLNISKQYTTKKALKNRSELIDRCKSHERTPTIADQILHDEINRLGINHMFQYAIYDSHHKYIVGFFIPLNSGKKGLAIEIEGNARKEETLLYHENNRDEYLRLRGLVVLRIKSDQVKKDLKSVMDLILGYDIQYMAVKAA